MMNTHHAPTPWLLPCWAVGVLLSLALPAGDAPVLGALLAVSLLALAWVRRWPWALLVLALALGGAYGVWRTERALARQWPATATVRAQAAELTVLDVPQDNGQRVRFRARATLADGRAYRVQLSDYARRDWQPGSRWQTTLRLRPVVGEVNAQGFNREAWALAEGVDALGSVGRAREALPAPRSVTASASAWWQRQRARFNQRWQAAQADYPLGAALMRALSLGEQSALPPAVWQALRPLGLNHLVSISGLHIGLVALLAGGLMRGLLRLLPRAPAQPRLWWLATGVAAATVYAALAGFAVPTQRALLMLAVLAWAWWRRHFCRPWRVWWLALALVLLFDPLAALAPGFWLSFALVAALLWGSRDRVGSRRRPQDDSGAPNRPQAPGPGVRLGRYSLLAVRTQWAAAVASAVWVPHFFGSLPLLAPVVNLLAVPWFSWVLVPLALLSLLLPWQTPLLYLAALAEYTLRTLMALAAWAPEYAPAHAPWPLLVLAVLSSACLLLPSGTGLRPTAVLGLLLFLGFRQPLLPAGSARLTVWDVGQGLAVSVHTRHHVLLFDTGVDAATDMQLLPGLRAQGVRRLDALVLSHHDADHDGGAPRLQAALPTRRLYAGQAGAYAGFDTPAQHCTGGQHWQWDGVWFEFLTPPPQPNWPDNEQSCVLRVVAGGQAVLITGDLGVRGEAVLVAAYADKLYSQILVLGHHGSRSATSARFLQQAQPEWAVASSGFANAHGHPHPQVVERLQHQGIRLYRTDRQGGASVLLPAENGIRWHSLRPYRRFWQRKPWPAETN